MAPFQNQEEIMLVDQNRSRDRERRRSAESNRSGQSGSSVQSNRSEADRPISAMQEPSLVRNASEGAATRTQPQDSGDPLIPKPAKAASGSAMGTPTTEFVSGPAVRTTVPPVPHLPPGQHPVKDSGVPLGSIRVPEQDVERPPSPPRPVSVDESKPLPSLASPKQVTGKDTPSTAPQPKPAVADKLNILVAEDDPINSKIIQKRLEKLGHRFILRSMGRLVPVLIARIVRVSMWFSWIFRYVLSLIGFN